MTSGSTSKTSPETICGSDMETLRAWATMIWRSARRSGPALVWSVKDLPLAPARLATNSLRLERAYHVYGFHRVDEARFRLSRRCARDLGVILVANSFTNRRDTTLVIAQRRARSCSVTLRQTDVHTAGSAASIVAQEVRYIRSADVLKNPGRELRGREGHLPYFSLRESASDLSITCSGSPLAHIWLGTLLLDLSAPGGRVAELCLESAIGFGGVADGSAEAKFCIEPRFRA